MSTETARDIPALIAFIESRMRAAFAWGKGANDCISFLGAAIEAQTGANPLAELEHTWTTARGAMRVLRRYGGLAEALDSKLRPISLSMAARGDGALVATTTGHAVMVLEGEHLVGPGPNGLVRRPRCDMLRAWSAV